MIWSKRENLTPSYIALLNMITGLGISSVFTKEDGDFLVFFSNRSEPLTIKKEALSDKG